MVTDSDIRKWIYNTKDVSGVSKEKSQMEYPPGIKWTKQRKNVYEVLFQAEEPLSAVQIYNLVETKDHTNYAVSTVYRILAAFEEQGLVNKTASIRDGIAIYELNRGHHIHYAVCLDCHKRVPMQSCPFAHVHLDTEEKEFTITDHKIELYGYCRECTIIHKNDKS